MTGESKIVGLWPAEPEADHAEPGASTADNAQSQPGEEFSPALLDEHCVDEPLAPRPSRTFPASPVIALLAVAWIALIGASAFPRGAPLLPRGTLLELAIVCVPLTLLALLWLLLERGSERGVRRQLGLLRELRQAEAALTDRLADTHRHWQTLGADLDRAGSQAAGGIEASAQRLALASTALSDRAHGALAAAAQLRGELETIDDRAAALGQMLPRYEDGANRIEALIRNAGQAGHRHGTQLETRVAALHLAAEQAEARLLAADTQLADRIAALPERVAGIEERSGAVAQQVDLAIARQREQSLSLLADLSAALERVHDESAESLHQASAAIEQRQAHAMREIAAATELLRAQLSAVEQAALAHDARLAQVRADGEHAVASATDQFALLENNAGLRLQALLGEIETIRRHLSDVEQRTTASVEKTAGVAQTARDYHAEVVRLVDVANAALPASVASVGQQVASASAAVDALGRQLDDERQRSEELSRTIDRASASIAATHDPIDRAAQMATALEQSLARLPDLAQEGAANLEQALDDSSARVRDYGQLQAGSIAGAVTAAVSAATDGGVERQLRQLAELLHSHSEQAANTINLIEGRIAAMEQRLGALRQQSDDAFASLAEGEGRSLGAQLEPMLEALEASSIDIARLLDHQISEREWKAYLDGEHGMFARRSARLLRSEEASAIRERFERDDGFRAVVSRYIHDFEAMLRRVMTGDPAGGLSATLLSSDIGKIYVALAQAIDRLR